MKTIETVSLIGLGAVGSAYLSKISETLPLDRIRVVADGERAERYEASGVSVNGRTFRVHVCRPGDKPEPADLLLFAVKFHQLEEAIAAAQKQVGPDTVVLSLLNGITSEREIGGRYGMEKMLYSFVMGIDATRVGDDTVFANLGYIPFGDAYNEEGRYSPNVLRVAEFFDRTGIAYRIPENMMQQLWKKFMLNVGVNQVTAILRGPYGVIQQVASARNLMVSAMEEVLALAGKEGVALGRDDIAECLDILDRLSPTGKTSMSQDVAAGRATEVDIFGGTVVALGRKYDVPVPVNEMLVRLIRITEDLYGWKNIQ